MAGAAGAGPVTWESTGIISEFSRCWDYLEHLGNVAREATHIMNINEVRPSMKGFKEGYIREGTNEGDMVVNVNGIKKRDSMEGNNMEKSQVDFIATFVGKVIKEFRKDSEPKVRIKCNFYNRGFCRQGIMCEFEHPDTLCEQYLKEEECSRRSCLGRHIYKCRYFHSVQGCYRGNSCEFLHDNKQAVVVDNVEDHDAKMDEGKSVDVATSTKINETLIRVAISTTAQNEVKQGDKSEQENVTKEMEKGHVHETDEDEEDGFQLLERAIDMGTELDDDMLDRILEGMEKHKGSNDEQERKKKKPKKLRMKTSLSTGKGRGGQRKGLSK